MEREEEVADGEKGLVGYHLIIGSLSAALLIGYGPAWTP